MGGPGGSATVHHDLPSSHSVGVHCLGAVVIWAAAVGGTRSWWCGYPLHLCGCLVCCCPGAADPATPRPTPVVQHHKDKKKDKKKKKQKKKDRKGDKASARPSISGPVGGAPIG